MKTLAFTLSCKTLKFLQDPSGCWDEKRYEGKGTVREASDESGVMTNSPHMAGSMLGLGLGQ